MKKTLACLSLSALLTTHAALASDYEYPWERDARLARQTQATNEINQFSSRLEKMHPARLPIELQFHISKMGLSCTTSGALVLGEAIIQSIPFTASAGIIASETPFLDGPMGYWYGGIIPLPFSVVGRALEEAAHGLGSDNSNKRYFDFENTKTAYRPTAKVAKYLFSENSACRMSFHKARAVAAELNKRGKASFVGRKIASLTQRTGKLPPTEAVTSGMTMTPDINKGGDSKAASSQ